LASISWNSVRVFSKLRTGLFRVLYHGSRFGTAGRIAYAHSIVGTLVLERPGLALLRRSNRPEPPHLIMQSRSPISYMKPASSPGRQSRER
jgi:hypothetical protein